MPAKTHRSDYLILGTLVAITAVILLVFAWAGWLHEDALEKRFIQSVHSTREDGVKAFYTLLEGQGIAVSTHKKRLQMESLQDVGVLVSLNPMVAINGAEAAELQACLEKGLILICTHVPDGLIPKLDGLPRWRAPGLRKSVRRRLKPESFKDSLVREDGRELPLAQDVNTVCLRSTTVIEPKDTQEVPVPGTALFSDAAGLRVAEYLMGAGRLILLSDSSFLANQGLGRHDNSVLAVNMIAHALNYARTQTLVFDEYHFAFSGEHHGARILSVLLMTTPAGWAILCLAAAGILLLIYQGRQFGPRHDLVTETRRSKLDYIQAVGASYCAAKAHGLALRLIYQGFKQKLAAHTALPPTTANHVIIAELSRQIPIDTAKSESALNYCDELLSNPKVSAGQLQKALQQLRSIEMEIFHEH
jgi:hypothetical protein